MEGRRDEGGHRSEGRNDGNLPPIWQRIINIELAVGPLQNKAQDCRERIKDLEDRLAKQEQFSRAARQIGVVVAAMAATISFFLAAGGALQQWLRWWLGSGTGGPSP